MVDRHTRKATEMNPREVTVHLSQGVQKAFADLAAAVHFSTEFDPGIRKTVQEFASGQPKSLHSLIISLPAIANETFDHVRATGDEKAEAAWHEIGGALAENGFTLQKQRGRRP